MIISCIGALIFDLNTSPLLGSKSTICQFSSIKTLSSLIQAANAVFLWADLKYKSQNIGIKYFGFTRFIIIFCSS
ncbi:MAG: hypothetical protein LBC61_02665 [Candidatus Peribacteria bacterium]|jgi:hypothetical protein|nr:hypothetical protein [Candidatus Peribacteria bacterium]